MEEMCLSVQTYVCCVVFLSRPKIYRKAFFQLKNISLSPSPRCRHHLFTSFARFLSQQNARRYANIISHIHEKCFDPIKRGRRVGGVSNNIILFCKFMSFKDFSFPFPSESFSFHYLSAINKGGKQSDSKASSQWRGESGRGKSISNRLYRWRINEVEGNNAPSYEETRLTRLPTCSFRR